MKKIRIYIFLFPLKLFFYCAIPGRPFSSLKLCFIYLALRMKIFRPHDIHLLTTRNLPIGKALASTGQHSTKVHIQACPERKPSSRIVLCYAMLCYAMLCYAMLCYAMLYYAILYYTILYYTILYYTILYYSYRIYYVILCYTILYYAILYCTILYYIYYSYRLVLYTALV